MINVYMDSKNEKTIHSNPIMEAFRHKFKNQIETNIKSQLKDYLLKNYV